MSQKQNFAPYAKINSLGNSTILEQAGIGVDDTGRTYFLPVEKDEKGNVINRGQKPVEIAEHSFFNGLAAKQAIDNLGAEGGKQYLEDVSNLYQQLSPMVKQEFDEMSGLAKIASSPATALGALQKGGLMLANVVTSSIPSALGEYAAEQRWKMDLSKYSKEDAETVSALTQSLTAAGFDDAQLANTNLNELKAPKLDKDGNIVGFEPLNLTESQKQLFGHYQDLLKARVADTQTRKTRQILGEQLDGQFSVGIPGTPLHGEWGYRNISVFGDIKGGEDQNWALRGTEMLAEATPETTLFMLSGGVAGAATRGVLTAAARGFATRQAEKIAAKRLAGAIVKTGGRFAASERAAAGVQLMRNNISNNIMKQFIKPISAASTISSTTSVFTQAAVRGYEDMRAYALAKGATYQEANSMGLENGIWNGLSECAEFGMFSRALKSKSLIGTYIGSFVVPEAFQEGTQQLGEDIMKMQHGLDQFKFEDIVLDTMTAAVLGGITGGVLGLSMGTTGTLIDIQRAHYYASQRRKFKKKFGRDMTAAEDAAMQKNALINNALAVQKANAESVNDTKQKLLKKAEAAKEKAETAEQKQAIEQKTQDAIKTLDESTLPENERTQTKEQQEASKKFLKENGVKNPKILSADKTNIGLKVSETEVNETLEAVKDETINDARKALKEENDALNGVEPTEQVTTEQATPEQPEEQKPIAFKAGLLPNEAKEIVGEQFEYYVNRHLRANPNATNEEIKRGWDATIAIIKAYGTTDFVKQLEEISNQVIDNINANSQYIKAQSMALEAQFNGLLKPETIRNLTSADPAVRTTAKWELAQNLIRQQFADFGDIKTGNFVAQLFQNLYYDYSVLYGYDPMDIYMQMRPMVIDLNRARLNGQLTQLGLSTVLDNIVKRESSSNYAIKRDLRDSLAVVDALEILQKIESGAEQDNGRKEKLLAEVNSILFGKSDFANNYQEILGALWNRQDQETQIYHDMSVNSSAPLRVTKGGIVSDPSLRDFMQMAILREFGYTQRDISNAFGLNEAQATNKKYNDSVQRLYPKLTEQEMAPLKEISKDIRTRQGLREVRSTKYPETANVSSFYDPKTNTIAVGSVLRNGQLGHEATHWLLTQIIMREANLVAHGMPGNQRVRALLNTISEKYGRIGDITSAEFQETVIDALFDTLDSRVKKKKLSDLELAYLDMKHELNLVLAHPERSSYPKYQSSKNAVKSEFQKNIMNLFDASKSQELMNRSEELETLSYGSPKDVIINNAISLLKNNPTFPNVEELIFAFEDARIEDFPLDAVAEMARKLAIDARVQAIALAEADNFVRVESVDGFPRWQPKKSSFDEKVYKPEMGIMNFNIAAALPAGLIPNSTGRKLTLGDLPNPMTQARLAINTINKTNLKIAKQHLADVWHTLTGSLYETAGAISPQLEAVIRDSLWEMMDRNAFDEDLISTFEKTIMSHKEITVDDFKNFETMLWGGYDGSIKDVYNWLHNKLGEKDGAKAWKALIALRNRFNQCLKEARDKYGIKIEINDSFYFPRALSNLSGFAHAKGYDAFISEIEKIENQYRNNEISLKKKIDLINSIGIRNTATDMTVLHSRTNTTISLDEVDYYHNIFDAARLYLKSFSTTFMQRQLFGKIETDENGKITTFLDDLEKQSEYNDVYSYEWLKQQDSGRVGILLNQLLQNKGKNKIDSVQLERFKKAAKIFAGKEKMTNKVVDTLLTINTATQLTQFANTLNQLGEMVPTAIRFGIWDSLQSAFKTITKSSDKEFITLEDVFAEDTEIDQLSPEYGKKLIKASQKITGFVFADRWMKQTAMDAGLEYVRKAIPLFSKDKTSLSEEQLEQLNKANKYINATLGIDPRLNVSDAQKQAKVQLLQDIANKNYKSENVRKLARTILTETQPLDAGSRPIGSNSQNAFVKAAYLFKTVGARQARFISEYLTEDIKTKPMRAAKRMANFIAIALLVGLPKEFIKDILNNRVPELHAKDSMLEPLFLNSYVLEIAKKEGLGVAIGKMAGADAPLLNHLTKAVVKGQPGQVIQDVPVVGKFWYNAVGNAYDANAKKNRVLVRWN